MPDDSLDQQYEDAVIQLVNLSAIDEVGTDHDVAVAQLVRLAAAYRARAAHWEGRCGALQATVDLLTVQLRLMGDMQVDLFKVILARLAGDGQTSNHDVVDEFLDILKRNREAMRRGAS